MTTKFEDAVIREAALEWGLGSYFEKAFQSQEGLLHELCHALEFGFRLQAGIDVRTTEMFESLNEVSPVLALVHEARTFAIERVAISLLRWQKKVNLAAIIKATWEQGYSGPAMPLKDFHRLIHRFGKEPKTKELGGRAARKILMLARDPRYKKTVMRS